jgi:hypothetical protein
MKGKDFVKEIKSELKRMGELGMNVNVIGRLVLSWLWSLECRVKELERKGGE